MSDGATFESNKAERAARQDAVVATDRQTDEQLCELCGLTQEEIKLVERTR